MEDFQQRVVEEKADLDGRLARLMRFIETGSIFHSLPVAEQSRQRLQAIHMRALSAVLGERIAAFKP